MVVLKDNNWLSKGRKLSFGPLKRKLLLDQLEKDVTVRRCFDSKDDSLCQFLREKNIMDYSLLVGVHDSIKGNKENLRDANLSIYEPDQDLLAKAAERSGHKRASKAMLKRVMTVHEPSISRLDDLTLEEYVAFPLYR